MWYKYKNEWHTSRRQKCHYVLTAVLLCWCYIQGLEFSLNLINRISRQQNPRQKKTVFFSGYLEQIGKEKQQWS